MNLDRLKEGSDTAWHEAYPVLWGVAFSAATRAHASLTREDCEDVAIRSISALMEMIAKIRDDRELKPLLATISHNQAISFARKKLGIKRGGDNVQSLETVIEEHGDGALRGDCLDPSQLLHEAQVVAVLHSALGKMNEKHRTLLMDRYLQGMDYRELAAKSGLSENSVGVYLSRGLEELRAILLQEKAVMKEIEPVLR